MHWTSKTWISSPRIAFRTGSNEARFLFCRLSFATSRNGFRRSTLSCRFLPAYDALLYLQIVDTPCYRCGSPVAPGSPFCKDCGAPQIRVDFGASEDVEQVTPQTSIPQKIASEASIPVPPTYESGPPPVRLHAPVVRSSPIQWRRAVPIVVVAAVIEAVFSFLGIGIVVGGFLSVSLYRRRHPDQVVTTGMGARLGAVAGGLAFFIVSVATSVGVLVFHTGNQFRETMMRSIDQAAARNPNPQTQQMLEYLRTPDGLAMMLGLGLLFTLLFYLLVSMVGGIAAAGFGGKRRSS